MSWTPPPHLVVKHKHVVVEGQSDRTDQHDLVQQSALNTIYTAVLERTFTCVLTEGTNSRL